MPASTPRLAASPRLRGVVASARALLALVVLMLVAAGCDYGTETRIVEGDTDVRVFIFTFDGGDLSVSEDGRSAFVQVEVDDLTIDVVDYGVVLAYADGGLLREEDAGLTWTALPITLGEQADDDIDVDYTLTYSYSYEEGFFYVDLLASEPLNWEEQPALDIRVVLIPGDEQIDPATDTADYAAVARALDLDAAPRVRAAVRPAAEAAR